MRDVDTPEGVAVGGALLVGAGCFELARVTLGPAGAAFTTALVLSIVLAIGLVAAPPLAKAGMGLIGLTAVVVEHLGAGCATPGGIESLYWFVSVTCLIVATFILRTWRSSRRRPNVS